MTQPNIPFDLTDWRKRQDLSTADLAKVLGVSRPQVWRLEKMGSVPRIYVWACRGYEAYKESNRRGAPGVAAG